MPDLPDLDPVQETGSQVDTSIRRPYLMIADNDELTLILLQDGLAGMGFETSICKTGKEVFLSALGRRPDVIVMNDKLSTPDAFRTIKLIRQIEPIRTLPIILLADHPTKEVIVAAIQNGANECLSKEISIHDVNRRVQHLMKKIMSSPPAALFEFLKYTTAFADESLVLSPDGELTSESGKEMVQLIRTLLPVLSSLKVTLDFLKISSVTTSCIGYLSDVKDTVTQCGGSIALANVYLPRYTTNIHRILETYFQIDSVLKEDPGGISKAAEYREKKAVASSTSARSFKKSL